MCTTPVPPDKWTTRTSGDILRRNGQCTDTTCGCRRSPHLSCTRNRCDSPCTDLRAAHVRPFSICLLRFGRNRGGMAVVLGRIIRVEEMAYGERRPAGRHRCPCSSLRPCVACRCRSWAMGAAHRRCRGVWTSLRSVAAGPLVRMDIAIIGSIKSRTHRQRLASAF